MIYVYTHKHIPLHILLMRSVRLNPLSVADRDSSKSSRYRKVV